MNNPIRSAAPNDGSPPGGGGVARAVRRYLKILVATVLGVALLIAGLVWLIGGIVDSRPISIAAGVVALGGLIFVVANTVRQSAREARAVASVAAAKARVGIRTCPRDEATAPTSPKPWYDLPLAIVLSLIPIGFGGVVLYALWFLNAMPLRPADRAMNSYHALFILIAGIAFLFYAIQGRNRRVVRCPSCGRPCGTIRAPSPRRFSVMPK